MATSADGVAPSQRTASYKESVVHVHVAQSKAQQRQAAPPTATAGSADAAAAAVSVSVPENTERFSVRFRNISVAAPDGNAQDKNETKTILKVEGEEGRF